MGDVRYDTIGAGYAATRREDPRIAALIHAALGEARTVVNVGAGAGSYEPRDRHVIAVEPSEVMVAQRDAGLAPPIVSGAYPLPFKDRSMDAAMAILTIHHWDEDRERGVRELRRVARGPVVILTFDPDVSARMWLVADYLPELAELDRRIFPAPGTLARWLDADISVRTVPISRDTPDWMLGSFWAHPERVLDARACNATSGLARLPAAVVKRVRTGSAQRLPDAEHVAFAVAKPRGALSPAALARVVARDLGDPVDRLQPRNVDFLEDDAAALELGNDDVQILDLEPHLRERSGRRPGRAVERELTASKAVQKPAGSLLSRLQAELLRVEPTSAVEIVGRQSRGDAGVVEHARSFPGVAVRSIRHDAAPRLIDPRKRAIDDRRCRALAIGGPRRKTPSAWAACSPFSP